MKKRKNKREVCYICHPHYLNLYCLTNPEHKITWSEYKQHIWCYDCEDDVEYERGHVVIPLETAKLVGIDYRRYNIKTGEVIEYE